MMKKILTVFAMFIGLSFAGLLVINYDSGSVTNLSFEGKVTAIDWKSKNHSLPMITIQESESNQTLVLSHYTISLEEGDLDIGDTISKAKGSSECSINGIVTRCVQ